MLKSELLRLKALLAKGKDVTDAEKTELETLKTKATEAKVNLEKIDEAIEGAKNAEGSFSDEDLKAAVKSAVAEATKGIPTVDQIVSAIKSKAEANEPKITADSVKSAVTAALKDAEGVDVDNLAEAVTKAFTKPGLSANDIAKIVGDSIANIRSESKMVHPTGGHVELTVAHRKGNLPVFMKQLLNVCLMGASEDALQATGAKRPSHMNDGIPDSLLTKAAEGTDRFVGDLHTKGVKALVTGTAGSGQDFMPADLSGELQRRFYLESELARAFLSRQINMPTDTFTLPLRTTRTPWRAGSEAPGSQAATGQPGTGEIVLASKKFIAVADYSYEADEDSIIAILPFLLNDLSEGGAEAFEDAVINGDTASTHQDSDTALVTGAPAKIFDGIRKRTLAVAGLSVDISTGGISTSNLSALRKRMGKWGVNPQNLIKIVGPRGFNDLVNLDEKKTLEKVGPEASINTGVVRQIFGIPVVVSSACREDLNASGVYDGSTVNRGSMLIVNAGEWFVGSRRNFTVETDRDIARQVNQVVASFRRAFVPKEALNASTAALAVIGRSYTA